MPAEEFSARALGGVFGAKSQEEVEAEEVWNQGSLALLRDDSDSPPRASTAAAAPPQSSGSTPTTASAFASAAAAAAADDAAADADAARPRGRGMGGASSPTTAGAAVAGATTADVSPTATPTGPGGGGNWREIRDKALAESGGSFTKRNSQTSSASSSPRVEFKRRCVACSLSPREQKEAFFCVCGVPTRQLFRFY